MRLINENKVIKHVDKNMNDDGRLNDDISCILEKIPTAYDVEKVIEQLEENAKYFQSEADELAQKGDWGTATDLQGRATAYKDAAEIVKSGGVADE